MDETRSKSDLPTSPLSNNDEVSNSPGLGDHSNKDTLIITNSGSSSEVVPAPRQATEDVSPSLSSRCDMHTMVSLPNIGNRTRTMIPIRSISPDIRTVGSAQLSPTSLDNGTISRIQPPEPITTTYDMHTILSTAAHANNMLANFTLSKVTTARTKAFSKPRNSCTYEDQFYKRKAFIAQGGVGRQIALRSSRDSVLVTKNQGFLTQQQAVLTRILTETVTEYEMEDDDTDKIQHKSATQSSPSPHCSKNQRRLKIAATCPTITEEPIEIDSLHCEEAKSKDENADSNIKSPRRPSKIPKLVLPGHGDPHLAMPMPSTPSTPAKVSTTENGKISKRVLSPEVQKKKKKKQQKFCKKCNATKIELEGNKEIIRLRKELTAKQVELLNVKSHIPGVQNRISIPNSKTRDQFTSTIDLVVSTVTEAGTGKSQVGTETEVSKSDDKARSKIPIPNPLVLKKQIQQHQDSSTTNNRSFDIIPRFDIDGFIKKYFKHILSDESNNNELFRPSQLLRLSIAARDCISSELRHKLKHGNKLLRRKYDILSSLYSSYETETISQEERMDYRAVLDSYRRFVRFIYHYFDESIKDIEKFDALSSNQQVDRLKYYEETSMVIDGKTYVGIFIPCEGKGSPPRK